jgi:hypothetical protein
MTVGGTTSHHYCAETSTVEHRITWCGMSDSENSVLILLVALHCVHSGKCTTVSFLVRHAAWYTLQPDLKC